MTEIHPLSLYVHIPFCVKKCSYCDFLSFPSDREGMEKYLAALLMEIETAGNRIADLDLRDFPERRETGCRYEVQTVFIGGGTPSAVPPEHIREILCKLKSCFSLSPDAEITMEMNPGTVTEKSLGIYREAGVNRVSLGCQSMDGEMLRLLGRIHTPEEVEKSCRLIRDAGFQNLNLDLISSLPGQKAPDASKDLQQALLFRPEHISVYSLIIEPGTPFFCLAEKGELSLPDEETEAEIDREIRRILREAGYERYEVSNFALPGYACRHNRVYWNRGEYLGLGLGAASLFRGRRFSNTRSMKAYLAAPGTAREEDRLLSPREAMEEFMFLGLRQTRGIRKDDFKRMFSLDLEAVFGKELRKQAEEGFLISPEEGTFAYTEKGMDLSNLLLAAFLEEKE